MYINKLIICIIFLIISNFIPSVISYENQTNIECAPIISTCGGIPLKITYPFWDKNVPSYCGHPSFKLTCKANSSLTITIKNQDYKILTIDYESKAFTISKPQFSDYPCPQRKSMLTNTTIDFDLLSFSSHTQNATLFYDCNRTVSNLEAPYNFLCSYRNATYLTINSYMTINKTWEDKLKQHCSFQIYVPILRTGAQDLVNGASISRVINQGFEVKWKMQCDECIYSGGRCGYNQTMKAPICFCQDGARTSSCGAASNNTSGAPKSKGIKSTIIVALGIGVGVCLLSSILCLYLYRRYQKNDSSAQFLTRSKSYSTSTGVSNFSMLNGSTYFGIHVFNYRELEEATDYFSSSKELGEGGFGTVYYGKLRDGREVAIKRLYENNTRRAEQFLNEVELLANIRHKNLVSLYGCTARQSRELLLVYEYVPNGTVADHLRPKESEQGSLPWSTRLCIATETASALVYLHVSDIVHRDVKTQNILLDSDFSVKVADFGLSRLFPLDITHVSTAPQGTPGYVDPEYRQCYQLTEKSDVYSFGVVLAELISSLPAVDITRRRNEINLSNMAINKFQDGALHEFVDPSFGFESDFSVKKEITAVAELMFQCLQSTKERRPSMNDVLKILLAIQHQQGSEVDSAEVLDIPADDVLMLKGDFSPASPPMEDYLGNQHYKPNASV